MTTENIQFLRLPAVLSMCGIGRSYWLDKVKDGEAPQPKKIGRASVWDKGEVQEWMRGKLRSGSVPQQPAVMRLMKTYDKVSMTALEDTIYVCALNVEDALLLGGAKPGEDYQMLDLYKLAMPVAAQIFHENADAHLRAG